MSKIVCFGEVLCDLLPTDKIIGIAPLNVTNRLELLGNDDTMITVIGAGRNGKNFLFLIFFNTVLL